MIIIESGKDSSTKYSRQFTACVHGVMADGGGCGRRGLFNFQPRCHWWCQCLRISCVFLQYYFSVYIHSTAVKTNSFVCSVVRSRWIFICDSIFTIVNRASRVLALVVFSFSLSLSVLISFSRIFPSTCLHAFHFVAIILYFVIDLFILLHTHTIAHREYEQSVQRLRFVCDMPLQTDMY